MCLDLFTSERRWSSLSTKKQPFWAYHLICFITWATINNKATNPNLPWKPPIPLWPLEIQCGTAIKPVVIVSRKKIQVSFITLDLLYIKRLYQFLTPLQLSFTCHITRHSMAVETTVCIKIHDEELNPRNDEPCRHYKIMAAAVTMATTMSNNQLQTFNSFFINLQWYVEDTLSRISCNQYRHQDCWFLHDDAKGTSPSPTLVLDKHPHTSSNLYNHWLLPLYRQYSLF